MTLIAIVKISSILQTHSILNLPKKLYTMSEAGNHSTRKFIPETKVTIYKIQDKEQSSPSTGNGVKETIIYAFLGFFEFVPIPPFLPVGSGSTFFDFST